MEDDFFFLGRNKSKVPWQSISIITIDSFCDGTQVYPDESDIDSFEFLYLFATLPESCFEAAKNVINESVEYFGGQLKNNLQLVALNELDGLFNQWKTDLKLELDEQPGTESLAILIQELFYP